KQLEEYFSGKRKTFDIKINPAGTEFQKRVRHELLKIPYGSTKSYSEIARNIGKPNAQRAVGSACNKNPIMIVIPCHRVVSKNGDLAGFACGLNVKKKLLELEKTC
ncbi:MAG: methylated-DNA--[Alphaproteobacteria bacterium]|nr:methylated-DNA--[protein]-cysteine S-methyltransferase [Alphaproteobacteria bacterium]